MLVDACWLPDVVCLGYSLSGRMPRAFLPGSMIQAAQAEPMSAMPSSVLSPGIDAAGAELSGESRPDRSSAGVDDHPARQCAQIPHLRAATYQQRCHADRTQRADPGPQPCPATAGGGGRANIR
jgi:hypothetical protein